MDGMWTYMVVGCIGALGAAACLGTLTALVRWHRTGTWPGQPASAPVSTGRVVALWLRVLLGAAVATWAVLSLSAQGLL